MIIFEDKQRRKYEHKTIGQIGSYILKGNLKCTNLFQQENFQKRIRFYNNNNIKDSILYLQNTKNDIETKLGGNTSIYKYYRQGINFERDSKQKINDIDSYLVKYFSKDDVIESIKTSLPAFVASVEEYNSYEMNSFIIKNISKLSGYITIDVDHIYNPEDIKQVLKYHKFVKMMFISPKGNGLKIICKYYTPIDLLKYKENYIFKVLWENINQQIVKQLNEAFYGEDVVKYDTNACDVNRLCFMSYDPKLWFNKDCEALNIEYLDFENQLFYSDEDINEYLKNKKEKSKKPRIFSNNIAAELSFLEFYIGWLETSGVQPFGESNYTTFRDFGFGLIDLVKKDENYYNDALDVLKKVTSFDTYYSNHAPLGRFVEQQFQNFWKSQSEGITYASVKYHIQKQIKQ